MNSILNLARRLRSDDEGATAIEYGLLAALIAVVLIVTIGALGGELNSVFSNVESELDTAENAGTSPPADD